MSASQDEVIESMANEIHELRESLRNADAQILRYKSPIYENQEQIAAGIALMQEHAYALFNAAKSILPASYERRSVVAKLGQIRANLVIVRHVIPFAARFVKRSGSSVKP